MAQKEINFSCNSLEDFNLLMDSYPVGNKKSNRKYLLEYNRGNQKAKEMLILTNLRLVFNKALKFLPDAKSYELMDIIQEGIIGLIYSIENFDLSKKDINFITFAGLCITDKISRSLDNFNETIRKSVSTQNLIRKYKKLEKKDLSDEEICAILNISLTTLKTIEYAANINVQSANKKITPDSDVELEEMISDDGLQVQQLTEKFENRELLAYLKHTLTPDKYFIIFHRTLTGHPIDEEVLAEKLGVSRQLINSKYQKALKELKAIIEKGDFLNSSSDLDLNNILPLNPEEIVLYFFFRDKLTSEEKTVFKALVEKRCFNIQDYASLLNLSLEKFNEILNSIKVKTIIRDENTERKYDAFRINLLKKYQSGILSINLDIELEDISCDYDKVTSLWENIDYNEALNILSKNKVNSSMTILLRDYFNGHDINDEGELDSAEIEINELLYGIKSNNSIPLDKLYEFVLNNKASFTIEQYHFALLHVGQITEQEFNSKFPNSGLYKHRPAFKRKLESMFFDLSNYRDFKFSSTHYLKVRDSILKTFDKEEVRIFEKHYGIKTKKGKKFSIKELSEETGLNYNIILDIIDKIRKTATSYYASNSKPLNRNTYLAYLIDDNYSFPDNTREILSDYLIEQKSYDDLAATYKVSRDKVSFIIQEGLRRIDFYRFGILKPENIFSNQDLKSALEKLDITSEEKDIINGILDKENHSHSEANEKYGKKKVAALIQKLYKKARSIKIESVIVDVKDIEDSVTKHISENILNEKEKTILAYTHGITCDINPEGLTLTRQEFKLKCPEIGARFKHIYDTALNSIREFKIGLSRPTFGYMSREELQKCLLNEKLPISEKERELLYYSFELNEHPYKNLNELSEIFGENISSLRRRIQRAFVTIFKYLNNEINDKIDFEKDVSKYLKYFSKIDQNILTDILKNNLSYEKIASKYGITKRQVEPLVLNLKFYLRSLIEENTKCFDFDYFWSHLDDDDVICENKEIAKRIFYLYFEKHKSYAEIEKMLDNKYTTKMLSSLVKDIMLAVLKKRHGFKCAHHYTYEEISAHYSKNSSNIRLNIRPLYRYYLNMKTSNQICSSPHIILDMRKANNEAVFDIRTATKQDVINFLKLYRSRLSDQTFSTLINKFDINTRELLNKNDEIKVLKLLASVKNDKIKKRNNAA